MLDTAALTVGGWGLDFHTRRCESKIPEQGYRGEARRAQQAQQHSPVQQRVDLGQCFMGDPRAEEQSSAGISP